MDTATKTISINDIRVTPGNMNFGFCVYGEPSDEIKSWANSWGFKIEKGEKGFANILVPRNFNISGCFDKFHQYKYVDGFSPNLNKHLHIGHMSNFIIAKAFQALDVGDEFISILGDTLDGEVKKHEAFQKYKFYCEMFELDVSEIYNASDMEYHGDLLKDGEGDYKGTKIFDSGDEKIVGLKSDGSTSYFYQDMALAEKLDAPTLYLTGNEQNEHFKTLKKFNPNINHIGLGLVKLMKEDPEDGKVKELKMSSRDGNVIYFEDILKECLDKFDNDYHLSYNVLAGFILKTDPRKDKKINVELIDNAKNSPGLYLSYTLARLTSAGVRAMKVDNFSRTELQYAYMKSLYNLQPNFLLNELVEHCKLINSLYGKHKIKDNPEVEVMFGTLKEDLELGMNKLGLFLVDKV